MVMPTTARAVFVLQNPSHDAAIAVSFCAQTTERTSTPIQSPAVRFPRTADVVIHWDKSRWNMDTAMCQLPTDDTSV